MENKIQIFESKEFGKLRTLEINNEPWFVGKDVANTLGYSNSSKAVITHVDDDDKQSVMIDIADSQNGNLPRGKTKTTLINESGMYSLILSSKLPKAKQFKRWITSDVLPTIRKNGMYMNQSVAQQAIDNPTEFLARAVLLANDQIEKLKLENDNLKPKAEFYDAVAESATLTSVGNVAKLLGVKGLGRNNMYRALRNISVLDKDNVPYQRYVDAGYFKLVESKFTAGENTIVATTTYVTQRGIDYIRKLIKDGKLAA